MVEHKSIVIFHLYIPRDRLSNDEPFSFLFHLCWVHDKITISCICSFEPCCMGWELMTIKYIIWVGHLSVLLPWRGHLH